MTGTALKKFTKNNLVNGAGELTVNAGRFSRAAVLMAFEMIGGVEGLAEWADDNPTDYYTKVFPKVIGREVEHHTSDDVEDMLSVLDGECEEITDVEHIPEEPQTRAQATKAPSKQDIRLARAAAAYARSEPLD